LTQSNLVICHVFRKDGNYIITQLTSSFKKIRGEGGSRTPLYRLCSTQIIGGSYHESFEKLDWEDYNSWLHSTRNKLHARKMFKYSKRFGHLAFSDQLVRMDPSRTRVDILKAVALLTRYLDIRNDTFLHEQLLQWLKRKEIKWTYKTSNNLYELSKNISLEEVIKSLKTLPIRYKIFALFALTTGLRPDESFRAFNNHSKLCNDGILELFWDRRTKKANAVYCHPKLHDKIIFTMSRGAYNYINKRELGFELRFLRKVNFTMVATKIDPLLAEFMQGRRGNVSQRHYFLPMMNEHRKKWIKVWRNVIQTVKI